MSQLDASGGEQAERGEGAGGVTSWVFRVGFALQQETPQRAFFEQCVVDFWHFFSVQIVDLVAILLFVTSAQQRLATAIFGLGARLGLSVLAMALSAQTGKSGAVRGRLPGLIAGVALYGTAAAVAATDSSPVWLLLPLAADALLRILLNCSFDAASEDEVALLVKFWKIFIGVVLAAQHLTLALKLAGAVECDFSQALWVYWFCAALGTVAAMFAALFALWAAVAALFLAVCGRQTRGLVGHVAWLVAGGLLCALGTLICIGYLTALAAALEGGTGEALRPCTAQLVALLFAVVCAAMALRRAAARLALAALNGALALEAEGQLEAAQKPFALKASPAEETDAPRFVQRFTSTYFKTIESLALAPRPPAAPRRPAASRSICPHRSDVEAGAAVRQAALSLYLHKSRNSLSASGKEEEALSASALLCTVCFCTEAEVVLSPCGHGGLCLRCAEDIWRSSGDCFLCRQPIELVLRYDAEGQAGQFRVVEVFEQNAL